MLTAISIVILVLVIFGVWWWFSEPSDRQVLSGVEEMGENLSKPHKIEFYIDFSDELTANKVCDIIQNNGFKCIVENDEDDIFEVIASRVFVPKLESIKKESKYFEKIAKDYAGEYGGWSIEMDVTIE